MATFVKYDGIFGVSKDTRHKGWVDVFSVDFETRRPGRLTKRKGPKWVMIDSLETRLRAKASRGDHTPLLTGVVTLTIPVGVAATKLSAKLVKNDVIPKVVVEITSTSKTGNFRIELKNVQLTNYTLRVKPPKSGKDHLGLNLVEIGHTWEQIKWRIC